MSTLLLARVPDRLIQAAYLPENFDVPDPADLPDLDAPRVVGLTWVTAADLQALPEMVRRGAHRFFERAVEARRCGQARQHLDQAILSYALSGTPSTATDALMTVAAAVSSWRDALHGITGRTASPETETGAIPMMLA
jgi:hypothetical protein